MIWIFDPLHRLERRTQIYIHLFLAIFFARLAVWHYIEHKWGQP